jgi:hypothetical protein
MAKAINTTICFQRIHEAARMEYLGNNKHGDAFQVMLNAEMYFWKASKCGVDEHMMMCHDMLVRRRKEATKTIQLRKG